MNYVIIFLLSSSFTFVNSSSSSSPLSSLSPLTFLWPRIDNDLYYGFQPSNPAIDSLEAIYLTSTMWGSTGCYFPQFSSFIFNKQLSTMTLNWKVSAPGFCVIAISDPIVGLSNGQDVIIASLYGNTNVSSVPVSAITAISPNGTILYTTILPSNLSRSGLTSPSQIKLVSNQTTIAILCAGVASNSSVVLIDVLSGQITSTFLIPAQPIACNGTLATVSAIAVVQGADGGDVLFIDGTSELYVKCSMAWVVTGKRAGQVIWSSTFAGVFSPLVDSQNKPAIVSVFAPSFGSDKSIAILGISPDTSDIVWTLRLSGKENFIAGGIAIGPYLFVLASFSIWRGCAAPTSTLYAIDVNTGVIIDTIQSMHYPDIGAQSNGALLAFLDETINNNVQLYWRETNGLGTYDSYITGGLFNGEYFKITSRYHGSQWGTNIAHDDQGSNPVKGCPPTIDSPPGRTGSMIKYQGQLLIVDWSGLQVLKNETLVQIEL
jgi:hypothetical protein